MSAEFVLGVCVGGGFATFFWCRHLDSQAKWFNERLDYWAATAKFYLDKLMEERKRDDGDSLDEPPKLRKAQ